MMTTMIDLNAFKPNENNAKCSFSSFIIPFFSLLYIFVPYLNSFTLIISDNIFSVCDVCVQFFSILLLFIVYATSRFSSEIIFYIFFCRSIDCSFVLLLSVLNAVTVTPTMYSAKIGPFFQLNMNSLQLYLEAFFCMELIKMR